MDIVLGIELLPREPITKQRLSGGDRALVDPKKKEGLGGPPRRRGEGGDSVTAAEKGGILTPEILHRV